MPHALDAAQEDRRQRAVESLGLQLDRPEERFDRIAQLGPSEIIKPVEALTTHFKYLEESIPSMPRNGWYRIDEIKKLLKELS